MTPVGSCEFEAYFRDALCTDQSPMTIRLSYIFSKVKTSFLLYNCYTSAALKLFSIDCREKVEGKKTM